MRINLKKILSIGLATALAATMSVSFADGDDDDGKGHKYRHIWNAFEPSVDSEETIAVSLTTSPIDVEDREIVGNPEPACVALQIATNVLLNDVNGDDPGGKVTPADSVTLFATLDGVYLVAPDADLSGVECLTPDEDDPYKPLSGIVNRFLSEGGTILVCPLCWGERGYQDQLPEFGGVVANGVSIHNLFLYVDKVITF